MAVQRTFSIIKPDATERNLTGAVNAVIEKAGLRIIGQRRIQMTQAQAERFYGVHSERPFFGELVEFMTSAPIIVAALTGENAIENARKINGATNPDDAEPGTIRFDYAPDVGKNIVHSSDSTESADREINYWFTADELADVAPVSFKVG